MHGRTIAAVVSGSIAVVAALTVGAVAVGSTGPPPGSDPQAASTTTVTWPTVPPFTAGPPTTTDPTVSTTLSPAAQTPPITLVPLGPEALEVVDALYEALVVFVEAAMNPDAPALDARVAASYAFDSPAELLVVELRTQLRDDGLRAYLNLLTPWTLTVESVDFFAEPYPRVEVIACYTDTAILYEPGGSPDGSDIVLDDSVYSSRHRFVLVPADGVWKYSDGIILSARFQGTLACPPA